VGGGFQIGLDIYDCICVINSKEALAAFMDTRVSLGSDLGVVAGPYGAGGAVDFGAAMDGQQKQSQSTTQGEGYTAGDSSAQGQGQGQTLKPDDAKIKKSHRRSLSASAFKPVFSYVKSRGFYAGIQVDGTVVVERKDANASFYGAKVPVAQILRGDVPAQGPSGMWPVGAKTLHEVLTGAEAGASNSKPSGQPSGSYVPVGSQPTPPTNPGAAQRPPPAYMDDGVVRPEVGDDKYA
jgi:lipid-binding SYLF domain-containing protein